MAQRLRKAFFRLLLVAASVVVGLLLLELFLAIAAPFGIDHFHNRRIYEETFIQPSPNRKVGFELKRNQEVEAGVIYRTNRLGARGGPVETPKGNGVCRILFLGDSITFGWGVAEEDTFVSQVERMLNDFPAPTVFECINLSALGYNTSQEMALLEDRGLTVDPDLVCIVFCANDVFVKGKDADYVELERSLFDGQRSFLDRFFLDTVKPLTRKVLPRIHDFLTYLFICRHYGTHYDWVLSFYRGIDEGFGVVKEKLSDFRALGDREAFTPLLLDLSGDDRIEAYCKECGLPYISLHEPRVLYERAYWNSPCDPHPNAAGHRLLAEKAMAGLKPHLVSADWLEKD